MLYSFSWIEMPMETLVQFCSIEWSGVLVCCDRWSNGALISAWFYCDDFCHS